VMNDMELKEQESIVELKKNGLAAKCRVRGVTVSLVKDPICVSRQGLGGSTNKWESKRDQGDGKQGYRDIISNVIRWANSYKKVNLFA